MGSTLRTSAAVDGTTSADGSAGSHGREGRAHMVDDWKRLVGSQVEVRRNGSQVRSGVVDAATQDGAAIWLEQQGVQTRMLVHRDEGYQVWLGRRP